MSIIGRLLRRLARRRPAPVYRGWQDFETGTYVTNPAPPTRKPTWAELGLPELYPWQEDLLRAVAPDVHARLQREHRRADDHRIVIHDAVKTDPPLTVFGIPVRTDPRVPRDQVWVTDESWAFPRFRTEYEPLGPGGGYSVTVTNEDADQMIADFKDRKGIS